MLKAGIHRMAIRLQDIADDLNLSKMTISKVLRGQTDVSAETKARVLKRVQELNYRPNISARGLRTGQSYSIGMVVPSLASPAMQAMVHGLNEVFRPAGYSLVLSSADGDAELEEREAELHLSRQVDALLVVLREDATDVPQVLKTTSTPLVFVGRRPARADGVNVGLREDEVGKAGAEHLLARGCRRIAYLRGARTPVGDLRFAGFLDAMRTAGITVRQEWVVETPHGCSEYRSGLQAVQRLLGNRMRPDGVVAFTDLLASGARDAAFAAQIGVPEHLQVIGCGNHAEICEAGLEITSIDLAPAEIGRRAARVALRLVNREDQGAVKSTPLSPRVVQRATTKSV